MSDIISIDKDKMRTIASSFEQESNTVQQIVTNVNRHLEILKGGGWIADAASQFYQQMDGEVMVATNRLRNAMAQGAQAVREIMTVMDTAEDEACNCLPTE